MANEIFKELKTRIALKYNTYEYWTTGEGKDYTPLKGEICFCAIESKEQGAQTAPTVLFKVGTDGQTKFSALKWTSALAADVYDWAKKSESEFTTWVNTIVEHPAAPVITTGNANGTIAVDGTDVAVKGLGSAAYANTTDFAPADINTGVHSVNLDSGTNNGTLKLTVDGVATDNIAVTGLQDAAYTTVEALNATAKGYADGVQENLTEYETAHKDDYTNTKIDELVQGAKDYADANDANTEYHVEYDSTNKKIKLVAGADASKMEIDASTFIKDGMISNVTIGDDNDLVITFNTDAGKENIVLPLDQLVDIYTGAEGTRIKVTVASDKSISADLVAGSISKNYFDDGVQASLAKADSALQAADLAEYAKTADVVTDSEFETFEEANTAAINAKLDANGWVTSEDGTLISDYELDIGGTQGIYVNADGLKVAFDYGLDYDRLAISSTTITREHGDTADEEGLAGQSWTYSFPEKSGTFALTSDVEDAKAYADAAVANAGHISEVVAKDYDAEGNEKVGGLKVSNKNEIAIDDSVVFVLDCNW